VRSLKRLLWYPILFLEGEILECVLILRFYSSLTLAKLPRLVVIVPWVHKSDAALWSVESQLPEVRELLRQREHLYHPLIIRLEVLDLQKCGALALSCHDDLVQAPACLLDLASQVSDQSILLI
jgi:hypothetical protein